jgi:hypothetical protein
MPAVTSLDSGEETATPGGPADEPLTDEPAARDALQGTRHALPPTLPDADLPTSTVQQERSTVAQEAAPTSANVSFEADLGGIGELRGGGAGGSTSGTVADRILGGGSGGEGSSSDGDGSEEEWEDWEDVGEAVAEDGQLQDLTIEIDDGGACLVKSLKICCGSVEEKSVLEVRK